MARKDRDIVNQGLEQIFGSAENDILSNVIQSDQRRTGRNSPIDPEDAASRLAANALGSEEANKDASADSSAVAHKHSSAVAHEKEDSVEAAIFKMLATPYRVDSAKGPFTVSTMKIPTILSERLTWVSSLTGRTKQDIVAEALKDYFEKVSKGK